MKFAREKKAQNLNKESNNVKMLYRNKKKTHAFAAGMCVCVLICDCQSNTMKRRAPHDNVDRNTLHLSINSPREAYKQSGYNRRRRRHHDFVY